MLKNRTPDIKAKTHKTENSIWLFGRQGKQVSPVPSRFVWFYSLYTIYIFYYFTGI